MPWAEILRRFAAGFGVLDVTPAELTVNQITD